MRLITSALLLSLTLTGCATTHQYGNFIENPVGIDQEKIASDTVQQLVTLYPPAKTRFELQQPTPDPFGQALVQDLRSKGYALLEFAPQAQSTQQTAAARPTTERTASPTQASSLPLRYILDQPSGMNVYRVTIMVGNQSITRPYVDHAGSAVAAGYWARKE